MPYTELQQRIEALMAETGCTRELASQAVHAATPSRQVETREQTILRRAVGIMNTLHCGRGRAFAIARETVD